MKNIINLQSDFRISFCRMTLRIPNGRLGFNDFVLFLIGVASD